MADFDSLLDELRAIRADKQRIPSYDVADTAVLVDGIESLIARVAELEQSAGSAPLRRLAAEDEAEIERLRFTASCYSNGMPVSLQTAYDRHLANRRRLLDRADEIDRSVA